MTLVRMSSVALILGLVAFTGLAAPATATDVGCGGQTVEMCMPVCVTEPCYGYVCVHRPVEICYRP